MMELIVYDLDGTLVDTQEDITASANHMLAQLGRPPAAVDQVRQGVGRGIAYLVAQCLGGEEDPELLAKAMRLYRAHYAEHMLDRSRLFPGARDVLEHFKDRRQAVLTNKPNPYSRELLRGLGVDGYFTEIIGGGDDGLPKKPDPAALLGLMERAAAVPERTLFIGDSPVDVETGKRAGVMTVAVAHGFCDAEDVLEAGPDRFAGDFGVLLALALGEAW